MNKYKAILFDYDGTLMDTNELIIDSWQHMARTLIGHELTTEELLPTFGQKLDESMEEMRIKYGLSCTAAEMCVVYRSYQTAHILNKRRLFPGTVEMLKGLKEKGYLLGIVTSRFKTSTEEGLRLFDIEKYFDAMVCSDDTNIHKPNPQPALLCCRKLGVNPEDTIMVGDSVFDLQCSHNAGGDACFVTWSFCTTEDKARAEANPELIINTPQDLLNPL